MLRKTVLIVVTLLLLATIASIPVLAREAVGLPKKLGPQAIVVQAHKSVVEPWVEVPGQLPEFDEVFEYIARQDMTLQDVQVYCSDASPGSIARVRKGATYESIVTWATPLVPGEVVSGTIIKPDIPANAKVTVEATGFPDSITDLTVTMTFSLK